MKTESTAAVGSTWPHLVALGLLTLIPALGACDATALGLGDDDDEDDEAEYVAPDPPEARVDDGLLVVEWSPVQWADRHRLKVHYQYWNAETFRDVVDSVVVTDPGSLYQVDLTELSPTGTLWRDPERTNDHEILLQPDIRVDHVLLEAIRGPGEVGDHLRSSSVSPRMPTPELRASHSGCMGSTNGIRASTQLYGPGDSIVVYWAASPGVSESSNREKVTGDVNAGSDFCLESGPGTVYYYRAIGYNEYGSSGLSPEISQAHLQ